MNAHLFGPEDQKLFGFVDAAILAGAVTQSEVRQWAEAEIVRRDEPPAFLFDVMEHDGHPADFAAIAGGGDPRRGNFSSGLTDGQSAALAGISFKRGFPRDFDGISKASAIKALARHPEVERFFREAFPFIEW